MFLLALVVILILILSNRLKNYQNYFKIRKIPYLNSFPLLGAFSDFVLQKKSIYECIIDIYNNPKLKNEKFFGIFVFHKPAIFIKDPKLIKQVLVENGNYFTDKMITTDKNDPMHSNIGSVKNPDWSRIRKKLTPMFTSSKLKAAFCHIDEVGKLLASHIDKKIQSNESEINLRKTAELYTIDVTANVFFGFNPQGLDGNINELHEALHSTTSLTFKRAFEFFVCFLMPILHKIFNACVFGTKFTSFMTKVIPKVVEDRERSQSKRKDFVDMLVMMKNEKSLSETEISAQAAAFFFGGYETTSSALALTFYNLAKHSNIQQKLCDEIRKYFEENEEISFEAVAHPTMLPYLDCVVNEVLRLYPSLSYLDRVCSKSDGYQLGDFKIPPGMPILIPLHALSHDEKYFDDPWTFKPERFNSEIPQTSTLPFGLGPRVCMGERFGMIMLKVAILNVLKSFRIEFCEKTTNNLTINKKAFILQHEENLIVKFVEHLNF